MVELRTLLDDINPYEPGKRASELKRDIGIDELIKLSSNESPFPPTAVAQKAMSYALKDVNRYPDGACRLLVLKLSDRLKVSKENIIVGNGSNELIRLITQAIVDPGDEMVMARPSFVVYPLVAKVFQAKEIEVPLIDFRHDLDKMTEAITAKTKIVFVCNPNNPTGTIVRKDEIERFVKKVPENVLVVFDEAYYEFVDDDHFLSGLELFSRYPNVVALRTFSKIYGMAGQRIGYGVAPSELVSAIHKLREPFNVNMVAQVGAYFSLDCLDEIEFRHRQNMEERSIIEKAMSELGVEFVPSQTNFIYAKLGNNSREAFTRLQQLGIIVRAFKDDEFVRITIGSPEENRKLIGALASVMGL